MQKFYRHLVMSSAILFTSAFTFATDNQQPLTIQPSNPSPNTMSVDQMPQPNTEGKPTPPPGKAGLKQNQGKGQMREELHQFMQSLTPEQRQAIASKMQTVNQKWQQLTPEEKSGFMLYMMDQKQKWVDMSADERQQQIEKIKQELQIPLANQTPPPANLTPTNE